MDMDKLDYINSDYPSTFILDCHDRQKTAVKLVSM